METPTIKLARNIVDELNRSTAGEPVMETRYGSLFVSKTLPVACIKLNVPREEYFAFLQESKNTAGTHRIFPVDGQSFDIAINGRVQVADGGLTINGVAATIL
jgi:hypothetical protein